MIDPLVHRCPSPVLLSSAQRSWSPTRSPGRPFSSRRSKAPGTRRGRGMRRGRLSLALIYQIEGAEPDVTSLRSCYGGQPVRPYDLIKAKRDGKPLPPQGIRDFISGYTDGSIPDYQMAAMCMAVYFRGLAPEELSAWTSAMLESGDVLDL